MADGTKWPWPPSPRDVRELLIFCGGGLGIVHQTLFTLEPNPVLIALFAAMIGFGTYLRGVGK